VYKIFLSKLRINLFYFIFYLVQKIFKKSYLSRLKIILKDLDSLGHIKIKNYFSDSEMNFYKKEIYRLLLDSTVTDKIEKESKVGNLKAKHMQLHSSFLKKLTQHSYFVILSSLFYGIPNGMRIFKGYLPTVVYTYTQDGTYNDKIISGKCESQIANQPHFDSYIKYLKIIILLEDVNESHGPIHMLEKSSKSKLLKKAQIDFANGKKGAQNINVNIFTKLQENHNTVALTGKKGDMILVNTKNIHWAGELLSGKRELLWLYFPP